MKAAFGILGLYLSIPLAIVAAQSLTAHQGSNPRAVVATAVAPQTAR